MDSSDYQNLLAELRSEYLNSFDEKAKLLQQLFAEKDWPLLELEYHKLKGTGTTYGLPEITLLCRPLEILSREKRLKQDLFEKSCEMILKIREKYLSSIVFDLENDSDYLNLLKQAQI